jgi:hypothetical protein
MRTIPFLKAILRQEPKWLSTGNRLSAWSRHITQNSGFDGDHGKWPTYSRRIEMGHDEVAIVHLCPRRAVLRLPNTDKRS